MQVILLQDVKGVGNADQIKDVSEGYARNFLFPKHLAIQVSNKVLHELAAKKIRLAKEEESVLHEQQDLAEKIDTIGLYLKEKASEAGVLYAAVGPQRISQELYKKGIKINKNQIENKMIKEAGEHRFKVKLPHGLEAELSVVVETL